MVGLIAFMVLAIDGGKYYSNRRVTQNAADVSSLAGLYTYYHVSGGNNDCAVLAKIIQVAEINSIPDSDTTNSTGACTTGAAMTNTNVNAYWINSTGQYLGDSGNSGCGLNTVVTASASETLPACAKISLSTSSSNTPSSATGILVRITYPYTTFIGHFIGQKNLQAQADGIALESVSTTTYDGAQYGTWLGGGATCNSSTNPALSMSQDSHPANNTDLGQTMVNGTAYAGDHVNRINDTQPTGTSVVVTGNTDSNFSSALDNSTFSNTPVPTSPFPRDMYFGGDNTDSSKLIRASFFRPEAGVSGVDDASSYKNSSGTTKSITGAVALSGSSPNNLIFTQWKGAAPSVRPANFYHYIKMSSGDAGDAGDALAQMISDGARGVFYIDGPIDIKNSTDSWTSGIGVSVISTSQVRLLNNNNTLGNAGVWAYNIAVMSDYTPPSTTPSSQCATTNGSANPAITAVGNQWSWPYGYLYAPNGLFTTSSNWSNAGGHVQGPVVAYSFANGGLSESNNFHFGTCQALPDGTASTCGQQPSFTINLNQ